MKTKITRFKGRALLFISAFVFLSGFVSACTPQGYSGPVQSISVAWSPFEHGTLLWIADDQNIFSQNGLNVTLRKYDTGAGSLDGMLKGEADITLGISELPMVRKAFEKSNARIIGEISRVEQIYLVSRKDRGIQKVSDLKGKRIGTTIGTIAEFYLGRFLAINGLTMQEVNVVDLKTPEQWENSVAEGIVDAEATAQPYADLAARKLGSNAIVWPAQGGQYVFGLVVSSEDWITQHPELVNRFLKSLAQAEEYLDRHPAEAKALMQKRLNVDASFVDSAWSRDQFSLSLERSLVTAMEDEARWMIKNNLTTAKEVPNFNNFIYEEPLKAVKPDSVNIIR